MPPTLISSLQPLSQVSLSPVLQTGDLNPAEVYLNSLNSSLSRLTMISPLNQCAKIIDPLRTDRSAWKAMPWRDLNSAAVRNLMVKASGSPATKNKMLAALKGVARASWELGTLSTEDWMRIKSIKGESGSRELAGRFVPTGEISSVLQACALDSSAAGARDAAMISLAAATGVRRAEISGILTENIEKTEKGMISIRLIGKRNKERFIYVVGNAALALADWLQLRFSQSGRLFCAILKSGKIVEGSGLSPTALDKILRKRGKAAGIQNLDWHDLRRTITSNLLDAGADISTVAGILGHANVQTTARYDRRDERAKIKASELVSVPYFDRKAFPIL